jgi:hypothetical protein
MCRGSSGLPLTRIFRQISHSRVGALRGCGNAMFFCQARSRSSTSDFRQLASPSSKSDSLGSFSDRPHRMSWRPPKPREPSEQCCLYGGEIQRKNLRGAFLKCSKRAFEEIRVRSKDRKPLALALISWIRIFSSSASRVAFTTLTLILLAQARQSDRRKR